MSKLSQMPAQETDVVPTPKGGKKGARVRDLGPPPALRQHQQPGELCLHKTVYNIITQPRQKKRESGIVSKTVTIFPLISKCTNSNIWV